VELHDRELIELAKRESLEAIAGQLKRSPAAAILKKAKRLGLAIKRRAEREVGRSESWYGQAGAEGERR
jgi:hypothetical protein